MSRRACSAHVRCKTLSWGSSSHKTRLAAAVIRCSCVYMPASAMAQAARSCTTGDGSFRNRSSIIGIVSSVPTSASPLIAEALTSACGSDKYASITFVACAASTPRFPSAPSIHSAHARWLGFPTVCSSVRSPDSSCATPSSASSAWIAASRACMSGELRADVIDAVVFALRCVFPVHPADRASTSSAAPDSPAASLRKSCSASLCMLESIADRGPNGVPRLKCPTKFMVSTAAPTATAVARNNRGGRVRTKAGPRALGAIGVASIGGLGVDVFSISPSVRLRSSSAGVVSASVFGEPVGKPFGRHGSKAMPQSVGHPHKPHKLRGCATESVVGITRCVGVRHARALRACRQPRSSLGKCARFRRSLPRFSSAEALGPNGKMRTGSTACKPRARKQRIHSLGRTS